MIQNLVNRWMIHRHFWRDVQFNELSELYTSMLLRSLASNVLIIFIPLFLYQNGYAISSIFLMYGCFFTARIFADVMGGYAVAKVGPKHTQIASCILQIISAAQFMTVPQFQWSIVQLGVVWGISASLFFISYHVQFSKIKHTVHAGKEIGYMQIMDKVGALGGPLLGGLVATFIGSQFIFGIAAMMLMASLVPLFLTSEPTKTRQKLNFKDFPAEKVKSDLLSYIALGVENNFSIILWPIFISIFVLTGSVYIQLGVLSSLSVFMAIMSAYAIGKMIDNRNARSILRFSAIANALLHVFRPFVGGPVGILAVNTVNEAVTNGYRMPYVKGMYAVADDLPGFRIVYVVVMETVSSTIKATTWFMLALLTVMLSPLTVIYLAFMLAAIASLCVMAERFKVLDNTYHG